MYYVKTTMTKKFDEVFHLQYCEVPDDLWVPRCVEEKWNGSLGYADSENPDGFNDAFLPEKPFPKKSELFDDNGLCKLDSEGEFAAVLITKNEFEAVWARALKENAKK